MPDSVRFLLNEVLDYAGLFPPANLSLDEALERFAACKRGEYGWLLSRFICPASMLQGVDAYASLLVGPSEAAWRFAAISRGGEDLTSFLEVLQEDLEAIATFVQTHQGSAVVDVLETKLPAAVFDGGEEMIIELAERSAEAIAAHVPGVRPFYEIDVLHDGLESVAAALTALQKFNESWSEQRYLPAGVKIRTGGPESHSFPSAQQAAFFIAVCRKLGLSFKATAGLHHSLRHHDPKLNAEAHGFLNAFVAAVLAHALHTDLQTLVKVLEAKSIREFAFGDEDVQWGELHVSIPQIVEARQQFGLSFGSCSIDVPIADLQNLGLIPRP